MNAHVIHTYTRAEAIEDGVLVDVTTEAKKLGFVHPIALTDGLMGDMLEGLGRQGPTSEVRANRIAAVLVRLRREIMKRAGQGSRLEYGVPRDERFPDGPAIKVVAVAHPGDLGEPVMTVMRPEDD